MRFLLHYKVYEGKSNEKFNLYVNMAVSYKERGYWVHILIRL